MTRALHPLCRLIAAAGLASMPLMLSHGAFAGPETVHQSQKVKGRTVAPAIHSDLQPPGGHPAFPAASRYERAGKNKAEKYARTLLRKMLQAEQHLVLSGDQITTLAHAGQDVTSEQAIVRAGMRAFRMEYEHPASLAGETIVDNGGLYWMYAPETNILQVGPSKIERMHNRVPLVMAQVKSGALTVRWLGQDMVAGHSCGVIEVASQDLTLAPRRRFWIDPTNGAQLRIEQYASSGQLLSSSYFTSVTYSPAIAPGTFQPPRAPKNARVVGQESASQSITLLQAQTQAGFTVLSPTFLPAGFHFQTASVSDFRQRKLVALRFVNGLNVLSLYETTQGPNDRGQPGRIRRPRPGVFTMARNGLRLILVGSLGQEDMQKIITSVP